MDGVNRNTVGLEIKDKLNEIFKLYTLDNSPLIGKLLSNGSSWAKGDNPKYEWYEKSLQRIETTNTNAVASGFYDLTPRDLVVGSTVGLLPNSLLRIENADKSRKSNIKLQVTSVVDATTVKAIKVGGTDTALVTGDLIVKSGNAYPEGSKPGNVQPANFGGKQYNYFQIFDHEFEVTRSAEGSNKVANQGSLAEQTKDAMYHITRQLSEMFSEGTRAEYVDPISGKTTYLAGGIREFMGTPIDGGGVAITDTKLNDAIAQLVKGGGNPDTIRCGIDQARKISALNNDQVVINYGEKMRGEAIEMFKSDIPIAGGVIKNIIVDTQMPSDEIEVLSLANIAMVPYSNGGISMKDTGVAGQDGFGKRMLGEFTIVVRDGTRTCAVIENLAI